MNKHNNKVTELFSKLSMSENLTTIFFFPFPLWNSVKAKVNEVLYDLKNSNMYNKSTFFRLVYVCI